VSRSSIIAIDGPAGTGKTTSAREVARRLGFAYIDSGALYRAIAVAASGRGICEGDDQRIPDLLKDLPIRAETGIETFRVYIAGAEMTERLREPEVTSLASKIAVREDVRRRVGSWLHDLASIGPAVVEGRDIGTTVFPDAELKVFLTASLDERARRRLADLKGQGVAVGLGEVARSIRERDSRDAGRDVSPLRRAPDAVLIDTTDLDVDGQVGRILDAWAGRLRPRRRRFYAADQWLIRSTIGLLWRFHVEGVANVPATGGVILASNHKSYLDPLIVGSVLPREIFYLAKKELFGIPLVSAWIRRHNAIPIDRRGFDKAALSRALDLLASGKALLLFPEGTRIRRPGLGAPREGIALLAARANVPIVPVHVRGSWHGERRGWLRGEIRVRYGEPIRLPAVPEGRGGRLLFPEISARIMEGIQGLAGEGETPSGGAEGRGERV
jgi:cytidylate kinase